MSRDIGERIELMMNIFDEHDCKLVLAGMLNEMNERRAYRLCRKAVDERIEYDLSTVPALVHTMLGTDPAEYYDGEDIGLEEILLGGLEHLFGHDFELMCNLGLWGKAEEFGDTVAEELRKGSPDIFPRELKDRLADSLSKMMRESDFSMFVTDTEEG